jgi:hypothetical protein
MGIGCSRVGAPESAAMHDVTVLTLDRAVLVPDRGRRPAVRDLDHGQRPARSAVYAERRLALRMSAQPRRVPGARRRPADAIRSAELHGH